MTTWLDEYITRHAPAQPHRPDADRHAFPPETGTDVDGAWLSCDCCGRPFAIGAHAGCTYDRRTERPRA